MKNAVVIPTTKNRTDVLFNNLSMFDGKYDVFLVITYGDIEKYGYDKYEFPNCVTIIETEANTISLKYEFIKNTMTERGYDYIIVLDDDVRPIANRITLQTKRTTSDSYRSEKIQLVELIDECIKRAEKFDAAFISTARTGYLGFSQPGKTNVNKGLNFGQFVIYNLKKTKDIQFDTTGIVTHDVDFVLQLLLSGLTCITLADYAFDTERVSSTEQKTVIGQSLRHINIYLKYRDVITLNLSGHDDMIYLGPIKYNKITIGETYIQNTSYTNGLYESCLSKNYETVFNYILNNKENKQYWKTMKRLGRIN